MTRDSKRILRFQTTLGLAAAAAMVCAAYAPLAFCADGAAEGTKAADKSATASAPASKPAARAKKLTGAQLYAIHCNRCHPERYPTEFTASQWKTLGTHMRVRANLPAVQVKELIKYLQEEAGS